MSDDGGRLILERSFDRTLWSLIEALIREGFLLEGCDFRKRARHAAGRNQRRSVVLQATHPDLTLGRDIAVEECANGQTAVTIKRTGTSTADSADWQTALPVLAGIEDRVKRALGSVGPRSETRVAAA